MRTVIQRTKWAKVEVDGHTVGEIGKGLLVLIGIEDRDTEEDENWLVQKICNMRIFDDENGIMNKSIIDIDGQILCVSQFTLQASTKKGNRPSYIKASKGELAKPVYERFCEKLQILLKKKTEKGIFGANMEVSLLNDGPVTIIMDSQNKE